MLHDRNRRLLAEIVGETPCRIGVEEVEIAERYAAVLLDRIPDARLIGSSVTGALLVRVLAVTQDVGAFEGEMDRRGQRLRLVGGLVEPGDDRGVVGGGMREGVTGERTAGCVAEEPGASSARTSSYLDGSTTTPTWAWFFAAARPLRTADVD